MTNTFLENLRSIYDLPGLCRIFYRIQALINPKLLDAAYLFSAKQHVTMLKHLVDIVCLGSLGGV